MLNDNKIVINLISFCIIIFTISVLRPVNLYAIDYETSPDASNEKMPPVVILEDMSIQMLGEEVEEDESINEPEPKNLKDDTGEKEDDTKEKTIELLQKALGIIEHEIERDENIVSLRMRIPALRKLRKTLEVDVVEKEKITDDLKSLDSVELPGAINSLQKTLDEEKEIMNGARLSTRAKRLARLSIKNNIPVKKDILASLNKAISELK